jgi:hypothetical protein
MAKKNATKTTTPAKAANNRKAAGKAAATNDGSTEIKASTAKAAKPASAESAALAIHINKTGRVCFGKTAAARIGELARMLITIDGKQVCMVAKKEATENTVEIRRANGRPHVSVTRFLKPLGFYGTKALDIEAAAYKSHGFEFKVV